VLARLSTLAGVTAVHVDVTGQAFVITASATADRDVLAADAARILGPESYRLEKDWAAWETPGSLNDGTWISSASIRQLSLLEARILSTRWGAAAAKRASLGRIAADHLTLSLRSELVAEFERIHAGGGVTDRNWFKRVFPSAFQRALDRLGTELDAPALEAVQASLRESLGA
jgi:hypothetical protein